MAPGCWLLCLIWGNLSTDCNLSLHGLSKRSVTHVSVRVEPKKEHGLCLDWWCFRGIVFYFGGSLFILFESLLSFFVSFGAFASLQFLLFLLFVVFAVFFVSILLLVLLLPLGVILFFLHLLLVRLLPHLFLYLTLVLLLRLLVLLFLLLYVHPTQERWVKIAVCYSLSCFN